MNEFISCLGVIALLFIIIFLGAAIASWLWAIIMVPVFGLPGLTYWQMFGLMWLIRLLFGRYSKLTTKSKN